MTVQIAKRLLTVSDYHKMAESGILDEDDRVELIHGEIIEMSPIGSRHAGHVNRVNAYFTKLIGEKVVISIQNPVVIGEHSEPEPDIAILRYRDDFYIDRHPRPEDVLLIIEVADSSVGYDREIKIPLFASAQIPECWIINLEENKIEVYKKPQNGSYQEHEDVPKSGTIIWETFQLQIKANRILG